MADHWQSNDSACPAPRPRGGYAFVRKPIWAFLEEEREALPSQTDECSPANHHRDSFYDVRHDDDDGSTPLNDGSHDNDRNEEDDTATKPTPSPANSNSNIGSSNPSNNHLPARHLSLFDLVSIGVGGTVGSGIFVLNGLIAHQYAGPAVFLSWTISGIAALLSGVCYAELSGRIPSTGSSYAYAYVALGELPAFLAAGMLSLEFLLSGSAVARSWGDKVVEWARVQLSASDGVIGVLDPGYNINPMACLVSILSTILVVKGMKESKIITDIFTWIKVLLVLFMMVGGFILFDKDNMKPLIPPEFGVQGVLRGSMSSFFGYLGFDAVCCVAGEAKNAERNLPLSIMITLGLVTSLYIAASIALVGMQNYTEISPESGYPVAFYSNGWEWAAHLTAAGEVITLPIVVLVSLLMQPRLQFALARDGLLPQMFSEVDSNNNPRKGALFAGAVMTFFATFVPFADLDDFISAGILLAFTLTNCSLIILRRKSPESNSSLLTRLLVQYNISAFLACLVLSHGLHLIVGYVCGGVLLIICIMTVTLICQKCPQTSLSQSYSAPLVPVIPCLGIFVNYILISRLSLFGIGLVIFYAALLVLFYFLYGARNSVARREGWTRRQYSSIDDPCDEVGSPGGLSIPPIT